MDFAARASFSPIMREFGQIKKYLRINEDAGEGGGFEQGVGAPQKLEDCFARAPWAREVEAEQEEEDGNKQKAGYLRCDWCEMSFGELGKTPGRLWYTINRQKGTARH